MAAFLDAYGETDARREKVIKWSILGTLLVLVLGTASYFTFRDYREEHRLSAFLDALRSHDYQRAYTLWGCTPASPCRDYRYEKFLEDWGSASPHARAGEARVARTLGCDAGMMADVRFPGSDPVLLWVERNNGSVGFFPWHLRPTRDDAKTRAAIWMWKLMRNCQPLIE